MRDVLSSRAVSEHVAQTVELLTSEVVTNAIVHAHAGPLLVVRVTRGKVRVEVQDPSPAVPLPQEPGPLAPSGRGMLVVEELARAWGVEHVPGGKRVWFEVLSTAPPVPDWVRVQNEVVPRRITGNPVSGERPSPD